MNIRKRFVVFSIIWGIVPVIISTFICISNFKAKNIELIKQNIITSAKDQSMNLEYFFNQNISELKITGSIPAIKDLLIDSNNQLNAENQQLDREEANEIFSSRKHQQIYLSEELLINRDGIIIAASDNKYINKKSLLSSEELKKLEHNEVVVTDIIVKEDFNNGIKSAIIATPLFNEHQYQGSMINIINMYYFNIITRDIHFFESGKVAIMDEHGIVATSSSKDVVESISEINNLYGKWKAIDFNNNPNGIIEYDINGIEKIGYYSRIANTGWIVFSGVEWAEFKDPINNSIMNIVIFVIFTFMLIITSYTFAINHLSKPIYKLLEVIRKIKQGNYKDRFIYDRNNEFGEIAIAFNDLMDSVEKKKVYIEEKNRDLQALTSNIPGGVHRNLIKDGEYTIDFLSGGCLNLLGYEKHEFKKLYGKKIFDLIYEKDRDRVEKEIKEQTSKSNKFNVEYRIKRKDGSIIWLLDNGNIVKGRDGKTFSYSVLINITDAKIAQEELKLSEERYRIIMSQTEDVIFEWNIKEDSVYFSENWTNKFNYESTIDDVSKKIHEANSIHKDDLRKISKLLNEIINGEKYRETEIRIRNNNNEYIWCKIRATAMFDQNDDVFRVIGAIIDIHKEKIEAEKLQFKAERDSLTSLYNKGTAQGMIEKYLELEDSSAKGALFVIDVDNFKAVNDNLGHLAGDYVLYGISSMLSEVFDENSIVGRIGGDEFIVFLKNASSEEFIYEKAENLVKGFSKNFIEETTEYKVSGSIGIAMYPEHGKSFKELFINADKAVYLAKNKGKDNYCVFEYN